MASTGPWRKPVSWQQQLTGNLACGCIVKEYSWPFSRRQSLRQQQIRHPDWAVSGEGRIVPLSGDCTALQLLRR